MLEEHVCPFAEELLASDKVRADLLRPECHQVYNRFGLKLHQLFNVSSICFGFCFGVWRSSRNYAKPESQFLALT